MEGFEQSWNVSSKEIQRLLRYIVGGCRNALLGTRVIESINSQVGSRPTTVDEINLLLLGQTGIGKSTLINSISNYFIYPNFKEAQKGKIDILIPIRLRLTEDSSQYATQCVKMYPFPIVIGQKIFNLRLIDILVLLMNILLNRPERSAVRKKRVLKIRRSSNLRTKVVTRMINVRSDLPAILKPKTSLVQMKQVSKQLKTKNDVWTF
ncbi:uncharacterized protein LOC135136870 [Zophobas morio]|uniref:uncharacterized protein LOC135136870 n=1 Tax=Zophobas morio TaxID=2755281 RepID=UPI003083CAE3